MNTSRTLHSVLGSDWRSAYPDSTHLAHFGMSCLWGAERKIWETRKVYAAAVGYQGGSRAVGHR